MLTNIIRRCTPLALILAMAATFLGVVPASASTPQCSGGTVKDYTFFLFDNAGRPVIHRGGCLSVRAVHSGQNYYFIVQAQDYDDSAVPGNHHISDDAGWTRLQYQTPGTTDWHDWVTDTNSVDFNTATSSSALYNEISNGLALNWHWRVQMTTHEHCDGFLYCGTATNWNWVYNYSSPFAVV